MSRDLRGADNWRLLARGQRSATRTLTLTPRYYDLQKTPL